MRGMCFHSDQYHYYQEAYGNAHAPRWYPGVAQLKLQETEDIGTVCQREGPLEGAPQIMITEALCRLTEANWG